MGLALAVFVPEGIVIVSDGIVEIRNAKNDNGFLQRKQRTMFLFEGKYIVCVQGNGCLRGLPYAFYIEKIFYQMKSESFMTTMDFAHKFRFMINEHIKESENLLFYVAGIDFDESNIQNSFICMIDNQRITIINRDNDGRNVYNYHSIGHNLWINKILLPTAFEDNNGEKIAFDDVGIDFSKYSIEEAIDFSKDMIRFSSLLDNYTQLKEMIGKSLYIGVLTTYSDATIITDK